MKSAHVLPLQLAWPRVARVRVGLAFYIAVYTVCPEKKETKIFLVISHTKLGRIS